MVKRNKHSVKEKKASKYANKRETAGHPQWRKPEPLNEAQSIYMNMLETQPIVIATGYAGTSKSFLPSALGAYWLVTGKIDKVVLARPNEPLGKTVGLLKGDVDEKLMPLLGPTSEAMKTVIGPTHFDHLHRSGKIEYQLLEYIKGKTFDNCLVIIDEAEDCSVKEVKAILTRIGENSTIVLNGDKAQQSLKGESGLHLAIDLAKRVEGMAHIDFDIEDIVRSGICRDIIVEMVRMGVY